MVIISLREIDNIIATNSIMIVNNKQPNNILFIGSCRIHAFLNYFINDPLFGNNYNYLCILVYKDNMIELSKTVMHNSAVKNLICNSTILVSEYIRSYDYFNTATTEEHHIFQIHNKFEKIIILPTYGDKLLYARDIITYGDDSIKDMYKQYLKNEISAEVLSTKLKELQTNNINKLCNTIKKSCIPELEDFVRKNVAIQRIGHTFNHPTNIYLFEIHKLIMKFFFNHDVPEKIYLLNKTYEFLSSEGYNTKLTCYDKDFLNIQINDTYYNKDTSDKYILSNNMFLKNR
jgi:hypothetical protein